MHGSCAAIKQKTIKMAKKVGMSRKKRVGNFRVETYKMNKDMNVGAVEVGVWISNESYETTRAIKKDLNDGYRRERQNLIELGLERLFHIVEVNNVMVHKKKCHNNFLSITIQFDYTKLGEAFEDSMWGIVEEVIINSVKSSQLIILDK